MLQIPEYRSGSSNCQHCRQESRNDGRRESALTCHPPDQEADNQKCKYRKS